MSRFLLCIAKRKPEPGSVNSSNTAHRWLSGFPGVKRSHVYSLLSWGHFLSNHDLNQKWSFCPSQHSYVSLLGAKNGLQNGSHVGLSAGSMAALPVFAHMDSEWDLPGL